MKEENIKPDATVKVTTKDSIVIRDADTKEVIVARQASSKQSMGYLYAGSRKR